MGPGKRESTSTSSTPTTGWWPTRLRPQHAYRRPLPATIHATEYSRNGGLHNPLQRYISSVEWWLTYEAWHVICCSDYMYNELTSFSKCRKTS